MENKHILTVKRFLELARPTSKHVEETEVMTFIRECEDMHIIPAIGLSKFKDLLKNPLNSDDEILLRGGEYENDKKNLQQCAGLEIALSYFVYAKMTMDDGGILTRTGVMQHNDSYAYRADDKNRVRRYNEVMNVAESYLSSSLEFLNSRNKDCCGQRKAKTRGTRVRIYAIGD